SRTAAPPKRTGTRPEMAWISTWKSPSKNEYGRAATAARRSHSSKGQGRGSRPKRVDRAGFEGRAGQHRNRYHRRGDLHDRRNMRRTGRTEQRRAFQALAAKLCSFSVVFGGVGGRLEMGDHMGIRRPLREEQRHDEQQVQNQCASRGK